MATGGAIKEIANATETREAEAALVAGRIAKGGTAENQALHAAAGTDPVIGVVLEDQATVGASAKVMLRGEAWVTSGAAFAINAKLMSDANGKAITAVGGAGVIAVGTAKRAATGADEEIPVIVDPTGWAAS